MTSSREQTNVEKKESWKYLDKFHCPPFAMESENEIS